MTNENYEGGCQCGAVRFEAAGAPKFVANCHCASCRKATGAAFSTWIGYKSENVLWLKNEPAFYASSPGVKRGFCARCGTPLTFQGEKWANETHFLIGAFDDDRAFTPTTSVFAKEALDWAFEGDHE